MANPKAKRKTGKAKRYRSVAEIKRDLFPNAAAEERTGLRRHSHEALLTELLGPSKTAGK